MNTTAWIVAALIAAFGIARVFGTYQSAQREGRAAAFARAVALVLPDALRPVVTERVALRNRGAALGLVAGIATTALVLATNDANSAQFASPFLLIGGAFAGVAVGVALAAARASAPLDPQAVKYARPSAVTLDDYVAPLERAGARIVVALAVITVGAAIATGAAVSGVLIGLVVLGVAALIVFEVAGRRIVGRGQPAESPTHLAWDDAVRASVLRDMVTAPIILGADAVVVAGGALVDHLLGGSDLAQIAIVVVCVLAAAGLAIASITSNPQRYFLRRLWPAGAAA